MGINGVTKSQVKNRLASEMMNKGFVMTRSDDLTMVFDHPVDDFASRMFLGSRYDSTPNARMTFNIIQLKKSVRVICDLAAVTNPGSAFERRTDINSSRDSLSVQNWLNQIAKNMEAKR